MAAQAMLIQETIAGMKQAISRNQDREHALLNQIIVPATDGVVVAASDSDESYLQPTNRGNKLKRKVHSMGHDYLSGRNATKKYKKVCSLESSIGYGCMM